MNEFDQYVAEKKTAGRNEFDDFVDQKNQQSWISKFFEPLTKEEILKLEKEYEHPAAQGAGPADLSKDMAKLSEYLGGKVTGLKEMVNPDEHPWLRNALSVALAPSTVLAGVPAWPEMMKEDPVGFALGSTPLPYVWNIAKPFVTQAKYQFQIEKAFTLPPEQRQKEIQRIMDASKADQRGEPTPMQALRSGETAENLLFAIAPFIGAHEGWMRMKHPDLTGRLERAGLKGGTTQARILMEQDPADPRLKKLSESDIEEIVRADEEAKKEEAAKPKISPPGHTKGFQEALQRERQRHEPRPAAKTDAQIIEEAKKTQQRVAAKKFEEWTPEDLKSYNEAVETQNKYAEKARQQAAGQPQPAAEPRPVGTEERLKTPALTAPAQPKLLPPPEWAPSPIFKHWGNTDHVSFSATSEFENTPIRYAIVELDDIKDREPFTQLRRRDTDPNYKIALEARKRVFHPSYLDVNPNPGQGAPKLLKNGRPLTGAGNLIMLEDMYNIDDPLHKKMKLKYKTDALYAAKYKHNIDLDPAQIDKMDKPVLAAMIDEDFTPEQQRRFSELADTDRAQTDPGIGEKARAYSSLITPEMTENPNGIYSFIDKMGAIGPSMLDPAKKALPAAEELYNASILYNIMPDEEAVRLASGQGEHIIWASKTIREMAPLIIKLKNLEPAETEPILEQMGGALRELNAIKKDPGRSVESALKDRQMFTDKNTDELFKAWLALLNDVKSERGMKEAHDKLANVVKVYEQAKTGGTDLFGQNKPDLQDLFKRIIIGKENYYILEAKASRETPEERIQRIREKVRRQMAEEEASKNPAMARKIETLKKDNADYKKNISEHPEETVLDEENKPVADLTEHPLIEAPMLTRATMPFSEIMSSIKSAGDVSHGAVLILGDSFTILGKEIPEALVTVDRKIMPAAIRRLNNITTDMEGARKLHAKLTQDQREALSLAYQGLTADEDGNLVKSPKIKAEFRKNPAYAKIMDEMEKGYAWARTPDGFNAPVIGDGTNPLDYMHHAFKENGIDLYNPETQRRVADVDAIRAVEMMEKFRQQRKGAKGWIPDLFKSWDIYVKQGMRKKYMKRVVDRCDAIAKREFSGDPVRSLYYNQVRNTAMGIPYTSDYFLRHVGGKFKLPYGGEVDVNMLRMVDLRVLGEYVSTIGGSLSTMVKHGSVLAYSAAEHPVYAAKAMAAMTGEITRMTAGAWMRGKLIDTKVSPALRNPMVYQSVENFYDAADFGIKKIPLSVQKALFTPVRFAEYFKRGTLLHMKLMMEIDKGTPLKTAYKRAVSYSLERGLPMGRILRNEFVRNWLPRSELMYRQPPAAILNMLYRDFKTNPSGPIKVAVALGALVWFQAQANQTSVWSEMSPFPHKQKYRSQWDVFNRFSPISQAFEYAIPSISQEEKNSLFADMHKARTAKQRTSWLKKAGLYGMSWVGVPISPTAVEQGKGGAKEAFMSMPLADIVKFNHLATMEMNGEPAYDMEELLLELIRVKTRPKYWYR